MFNYLSAIQSFVVRFSLDIQPFQDQKISLYLKAIQISSPKLLKLHNFVDKHLLLHLVTTCDLTYMGHIFKTAYLQGFFGLI